MTQNNNPLQPSFQPSQGIVRIAAVQYLIRSISNWDEFENQVRFVMKAAGDYKPQFVMFPEIFTTQLLSFMDTSDLRKAVRAMDGYTERYIAAIENEIAQVIFSNGDDSELYFRKGVGGDDISGDYNTYDVTEEQTIDGHTVLCKGNDGLIYTATWTDGTYSYAVMCDAGMNVEQLSVWVEALA